MMTDSTPTSDLERALHLADVADAITIRHYRSVDLVVTAKPDASPVTEGDLEVEQTLSGIVHTQYHDAYIGEENVRDEVKGRRWIVDPIDGTKNFIRHMPIWATLIALEDDAGGLAAVASAPALGRRWWAARSQGSWTRDVDGSMRRISVSGVSDLANAFLTHGSLFAWNDVPTGLPAFLKLLESAWRHRGLGDALGHLLVAEGAVDAALEPNIRLWDIAAPRLIISEAGGSVWTSGNESTPPGEPRIVISSNGALEPVLRAALGA